MTCNLVKCCPNLLWSTARICDKDSYVNAEDGDDDTEERKHGDFADKLDADQNGEEHEEEEK